MFSSLMDLRGRVTEYLPVPTTDRPGFVMVFVVCDEQREAEEEGCWCSLTKDDEYDTGFAKFFRSRTGEDFRVAARDLHEYCGAVIDECTHSETKPDHSIQRKFEYLIFPDIESFLRGQEWFEARWLSGKLKNPEK